MNKTKLKGLVWYLKVPNRRLILQVKNTGVWMNIRCTIVSGTLLSATESWYFLCASYNISPLNLQSYGDIFDTAFGVTHSLSCITGSLFIGYHNEICDGILCISRWAFSPVSVRTEPLIHHGRTISEQVIRQGSYKDKETREDVIIRFLWDRQVESIIDVKLGNTDVDSY